MTKLSPCFSGPYRSLAPTMCRTTSSRWNTILLVGLIHFTATVCVALQAPFYPKEAEKKGASATEYGLVFGIFELISFVACPIFGKYLDVLGAKFALTGGALLSGVSCVCFGLLDRINGHAAFVAMSFAVRSVEAIGASAIFTAAVAIAANKCPDRAGTTFALLEVFYGLGYIVGPSVGGFLFQVGGFFLPFAITGSFLILASVLTATCLETPPKSGKQPSLLKLIVSPGVVLNSLVTVATAITMGFYSVTLEPHLRQFNLSPSEVGGMFVISGGFYAVLTLPVGRIVDSYLNPKHVVVFGAVLTAVGVCFIGPAEFIPYEPTMWTSIVGLLFHGVGLACLMPPTFADSILSAVSDGFPDDMTTHALVSGLWASAFALGAFVGPSVAGYLLDTVGFRKAAYLVIATSVVVVVLELVFIFSRLPLCRRSRTRNDCLVSPEVAEGAFAATAISSLAHNGPKSLRESPAGSSGCGQYDTFGRPVPSPLAHNGPKALRGSSAGSSGSGRYGTFGRPVPWRNLN